MIEVGLKLFFALPLLFFICLVIFGLLLPELRDIRKYRSRAFYIGIWNDILLGLRWLAKVFIGLSVCGLVCGLIYLAFLYFFNPQEWYASKYSVPSRSVYIEPKPHDCEWDAAPIGNKYCHYKKSEMYDSASKSVYLGWEKVTE
jgi:hypothetical protein